MVVIVIRAQPNDSGEEIYSTRVHGVENPPRVFASSQMPETYDGRDCFNESWPSSPDLILDAKPGARDYEFVSRNRAFYCETPKNSPWEDQNHSFRSFSSVRSSRDQKASESRLDSPLSRDSGYCDKVTPYNAKRMIYCKVAENRDKSAPFRKISLASSTMLAKGNRCDIDNNIYLSSSSQVDTEDSIATTKEEEWVTKKKIELTTTRQIETRVKRQVLLEDGKVVEDSGPVVTTNTTEDTEKQEHSQTEHRTLGDDNSEENWISLPNPSGCVKEVQEKTVRSREETEERTETENIQHLGDFSDEGYMTAIKSNSDDFRQALEDSNKNDLVDSGPKIIHQSLKTKKCVDTEDKTERSQVQPGGKLVSETRKTLLHEEYDDCNISDNDSSNSVNVYETSKKKNSQRFRKSKEQELTEYLANGQKIGEKLHHQAETTEGERDGDVFNFDEMESLPSRLKRMRLRAQNNSLALEKTIEQKDILCKNSSNYEQDEETRKAETSKWLEHHFGSESTKSSKGSVEDLDDIVPSSQSSFINVTMKSQPLKKTSKIKHVSSSNGHRTYSERVIKTPSSDNESHFRSPGIGGYFRGTNPWSSRREGSIDSLEKSFDPTNIDLNARPHNWTPLKFQKNRNNFTCTPLVKKESSDRYSPTGELFRNFQPLSQTKSDANVALQSKVMSYKNYDNHCETPSSYQYTAYEKGRPSPPLRKKQRDVVDLEEKPFDVTSKKDLRKINGLSFDPENLDNIPYRSPALKDGDVANFSLPGNKKLYQRTRFAADIPPPPPPPQSKSAPAKQKSKISESFKKFVGKLRSSSQDRKNKKKSKSNGSRSPSPRENTYQNYNSLDNYGSLVDRDAEEIEEPIASPREKYNENIQSQFPGKGDRLVQRYYLGEDPFSTSIYGREREYEENNNIKNRTESDNNAEYDFKSRTLGRFSKSSSRLTNSEIQKSNCLFNKGGAQTLPRKFRDENVSDKPVVYKNLPGPLSKKLPSSTLNQRKNKEFLPHTSSMINVSFVNHPSTSSASTDLSKRSGISLNGPVKPARTYRSNLSRSQSFNVQSEERSCSSRNPYKSNPHLHRLDEMQAPLESPSIISNWNQSSGPVNEKITKFRDNKDKQHLFMKELYDRAPELFKTLHGDNLDEMQNFKEERNCINYNNSFRSSSTVNTNSSIDASNPHYNCLRRDNYLKPSQSPIFTETYYDENNLIKTVSRSESSGNDDFSETVRIQSKSDNPLYPSETDTVKTFTKKKIPVKNGLATETIKSSETKTIQKSQGLRQGLESNRSFYNTSPVGIVITVRNSRN